MKTRFVIPGIVATMTLVACSSGGDGGPAAPIGDLRGEWSQRTVADLTDCGEGSGLVFNDFFTVVSQSGNNLVDEDGNTASISGNTVNYTETFTESGLDFTLNSILTIAEDCNSYTGNGNLTATDGVDSCTGTYTVSGERSSADGCGTAPAAQLASHPEAEPNNSAHNANILFGDLAISGSVNSNDDAVDVFAYTVNAAGDYSLRVQYDALNSLLSTTISDVNLDPVAQSTGDLQLDDLAADDVIYVEINAIAGNGDTAYTLVINRL